MLTYTLTQKWYVALIAALLSGYPDYEKLFRGLKWNDYDDKYTYYHSLTNPIWFLVAVFFLILSIFAWGWILVPICLYAHLLIDRPIHDWIKGGVKQPLYKYVEIAGTLIWIILALVVVF